jgi:hypothetical protein
MNDTATTSTAGPPEGLPAALPGPSPRALRRGVGPLEGFVPVFLWGLRLVLKGRRFVLILAMSALLGALMGFQGVRGEGGTYDPAGRLLEMLDQEFLQFAVPIVALLLVSQGFAREVQDRTLVHHLVRPVSRRTIYLARYASGVLAAAIAAVTLEATLLGTSGVPLGAATWVAALLAMLAGVVAVGAVYYALSAVFRYGVILGMVYTFVVEAMFAGARGSMQRLSVMFHVRSLHHRWTDDALQALARPRKASSLPELDGIPLLSAASRIEYDTPGSALLVLACVTVAALLVGSYVVSRKDYALKD